MLDNLYDFKNYFFEPFFVSFNQVGLIGKVFKIFELKLYKMNLSEMNRVMKEDSTPLT